jgi:hypothetical protein
MKTTLGLGTALLLGAAVLGGCGAGDDAQTVEVEATPEFLAASARRTTDASTGRFETRTIQRFEVPDDEQIVTETIATGVYDATAEVMSADQHQLIETPGPELEGDGELVQAGGSVYVRDFPFTEEPYGLEEGEWAELVYPEELEELSGATGDAGAVASPSELLDLLLEQVDDVTEVGREEVRGVSTTHLSATYQLPDAAIEAFDELTGGEVDPPEDIPLDVWVDDEGLIRRVETDNQIGEGVGSVRTSVTTAYWDFGVEVDVDVPEASTTLDPLDPLQES